MCDGHHTVLAKKLDCVSSKFDPNSDPNSDLNSDSNYDFLWCLWFFSSSKRVSYGIGLDQ
jgi:hypothetical protein